MRNASGQKVPPDVTRSPPDQRLFLDGTPPVVCVAAKRVGDDVEHTKWGEGVILHMEGDGDKTEAVVRFPSEGEKRLLLSWAPIKKVQR